MTDANTIKALTSTGKDDWMTPPAVLRELNAEFGFTLDAAAAKETFPGVPWLGPGGLVKDALEDMSAWARGFNHSHKVYPGAAVFLNPPYSRAAGRGKGVRAWHRMARRAAWLLDLTVVVLCPPHPGRGWFHEHAVCADEIRVYKSRLAFVDPATGLAVKGNTQDSCLVIYRGHVPVSGWPGGPRWSWIDVPR